MKESQNVKHPVVTRLGEILQDSEGLFTLLKLNILFFITCLPFAPFITIFTFGRSCTALSVCISELVKTGNLNNVRKKYMHYFKTYFKKSFVYGLFVYIFTALSGISFNFYINLAGGNIIYVPFASLSLIICIFIWCIAVHLFPGLINNQLSTAKELLSYSALQFINNMKATLIAVILGIIITVVMILLLPATVPLVLTCSFSVPALAAGFAHTKPVFLI